LRRLFAALSDSDIFSKDELAQLCFDAGLDCEQVDDRTLSSMALGMIGQARRQGPQRVQALRDAMIAARPKLEL
jgi:hypothetical protein